MNIIKDINEEIKKIIKKNKKFLEINNINVLDKIQLEIPPEKYDYDFSSNAAMIISKINKLNTIALAEKIRLVLLKNKNLFKDINIAGPGFLNLNLSEDKFIKSINKILKKKDYGASKYKNKYNIEFVSANPTGPIHVGHSRGAIFGDVLSNLLKFNGNKVVKEYYINDYGNQIINFTKSVFLRLREIKHNEQFSDDPNLYPGLYVKDIAKEILKRRPNINLKKFENIFNFLKKNSVMLSMNLIKEDLKKLGISHDNFTSETDIVEKKFLNQIIKILKKRKIVINDYLEPPKGAEKLDWKKIKRLVFKSTLYGDDADRALQKNDGSWTYFANDLAYHYYKIKRYNSNLINILGADHTGYVKRITSAVKAISNGKVMLNCKVCQLVKLFKNGEPFKMSKRSGEFVSVSELLKEVNRDALRFMMLYRSNDVELDFDFAKVIEKSKDNPVFYVQYCNARINSIFSTINESINKKILIKKNFDNLNHYEKKIIRKIFEWPNIIENSSIKLEPHRIPFYLYELSTIFHSYWSKGNNDVNFRFIENGKIKNVKSLVILKLISITLTNGMKILGVSLPKKM